MNIECWIGGTTRELFPFFFLEYKVAVVVVAVVAVYVIVPNNNELRIALLIVLASNDECQKMRDVGGSTVGSRRSAALLVPVE